MTPLSSLLFVILVISFSAYVLSQIQDCKTVDSHFDGKALQEKRFADYENRPLKYCGNVADLQGAKFDEFWSKEEVNTSTWGLPFFPPPMPEFLLHKASPPGSDVIMGIAYFKGFKQGLRRFVGSLRHYKYNGHIILGVHSEISTNITVFTRWYY